MLGSLILPPDAPADAPDRLLADVAARLAAEGVRVAGAVQGGGPDANGGPAEMRLTLLGPSGGIAVISQPLGPGAGGCRLDPGALEAAALRVAQALPDAQLLILSKFGRQEAAGRGFRPVVAEAIGRGLPVLAHVGRDVADEFAEFTAGLAQPVEGRHALDWCRSALRARADG